MRCIDPTAVAEKFCVNNSGNVVIQETQKGKCGKIKYRWDRASITLRSDLCLVSSYKQLDVEINVLCLSFHLSSLPSLSFSIFFFPLSTFFLPPSLSHSLSHSLPHSLPSSFPPLITLFLPPFLPPFPPPSLPPSFTPSLPPSLLYSLTHSFTHSLTHSRTHTLFSLLQVIPICLPYQLVLVQLQ